MGTEVSEGWEEVVITVSHRGFALLHRWLRSWASVRSPPITATPSKLTTLR